MEVIQLQLVEKNTDLPRVYSLVVYDDKDVETSF